MWHLSISLKHISSSSVITNGLLNHFLMASLQYSTSSSIFSINFFNGVFTPIYLDWFAIFVIIATYDLISTATVFMSLIGFNVRSHILFPFHLLIFFTTLHPFRDSLEISIDYEWNWQLFMKVVEF